MDMEFDKAVDSEIGDSNMEQNRPGQDDLLDTTDCLEAIGVFKGWKNFLFIIVFGSLLLQQVLFWTVNSGWVKPEAPAEEVLPVVVNEPNEPTKGPGLTDMVEGDLPEDPNEILEAAGRIVADPNLSADEGGKKSKPLATVDFKYAKWLIRILNFALIMASTLYCLTLLFALKVSLLGRLGGINHICRAFFLSLVFLVLLLPWQQLIGSVYGSEWLVVRGEIFTPGELLKLMKWHDEQHARLFVGVLYYLRFVGYWLFVMLILVFSLLRSGRWAKATLRRLEII